MALPTDKTKGPIRVSAIRSTFGGESPDGMSEYYKGGAYVDDNDIGAIPASGRIKASDFYGARPANPLGSKTFTAPGIFEIVIPEYDNIISFECRGGGGASGESSYDGPAPGNDPGGNGFPGQGSYAVAPYGSIKPGETIYAPFRRQPIFYLGEPTVLGAWSHGPAGQGGNGWPSTVPGVSGVGAVNAQEPDDIVETGGGGAGGICPPFFGNSSEPGTTGGAGGRAVKVFKRGEANSPQPGDTWKLHVGAGGRIRGSINGAGSDGSIIVSWS